MGVLYTMVNPLTMWLTFVTFVGYALVYTILLKPNTPQNIVIGGLSGAMPPALGWAAVANTVPMEAWLLVLIIFVWTPPHFWALAMYRRDDYVRSGLPMLPVTHGMQYTGQQVWLYSIALAACTLLPVRGRHERPAVPGGRRRPERRVPALRLAGPQALQRPDRAQGLRLVHRLPVAAVRGAAGRPLRETLLTR
jgi:4-hydroxybenzoate polyprenyltransferase